MNRSICAFADSETDKGLFHVCCGVDVNERLLREQLGIVMFLVRFQLLPPLKERPESGIWLLGDDTLVCLVPNLHTNKRHTDVQGFVELKADKKGKGKKN